MPRRTLPPRRRERTAGRKKTSEAIATRKKLAALPLGKGPGRARLLPTLLFQMQALGLANLHFHEPTLADCEAALARAHG